MQAQAEAYYREADALATERAMRPLVAHAAPPVLIYAFLMDYYIAGPTAVATKG